MTEEQLSLLDFIRSEIEAKGIAPTYAEMCAHFGWLTKSTPHRLVRSLVRAGRLRRDEGRDRGLSLPNSNLVAVRTSALRAELRRREVEPDSAVVAIHIGPGNFHSYHAYGEAPLRLLVVDENAPGDRVYEIRVRHPLSELVDLVPEGSTVGSIDDGRTPALVNRLEAAREGRRHLEAVPS